eukprot:scaffold28375_cov63-Phaeocystis_antarctica.AAC.3
MATSVYKLLQGVVAFGNAAGTLNNAALLQAVADPVGSTLSEHLTALAARSATLLRLDWNSAVVDSPPAKPSTPTLATRHWHPILSLPAPRYPGLAPDTLAPCSPLRPKTRTMTAQYYYT